MCPCFCFVSVFGHHFLEAGNIGLVVIDKIQHVVLHCRVFLIVQYIELRHIPVMTRMLLSALVVAKECENRNGRIWLVVSAPAGSRRRK